MPAVDRRPAAADDVLVEVLARAQPEGEPAVAEQVHGRSLLGHDGGVVAHRRAGHIGHQLDPLGHLGDRAQHAPGVRRVALRVQPRGVVVAGHLEVEARLLGRSGVADKLTGAGLLGHQRVAEPRHGQSVPVRSVNETATAAP